MRTLFGRTSYNKVSRFIEEIPSELLINIRAEERQKLAPSQSARGGFSARRAAVSAPQPVKKPVETGGNKFDWKVGDKVQHKKWGVGTVVSVKGQDDNKELDIAFPSPTGIKRLLAAFAPIEKV